MDEEAEKKISLSAQTSKTLITSCYFINLSVKIISSPSITGVLSDLMVSFISYALLDLHYTKHVEFEQILLYFQYPTIGLTQKLGNIKEKGKKKRKKHNLIENNILNKQVLEAAKIKV